MKDGRRKFGDEMLLIGVKVNNTAQISDRVGEEGSSKQKDNGG